MGKVVKGFKIVLLPQGVILLAAVLLAVCARYPDNAMPIAAARSAHAFITPNAKSYTVPSIDQLSLGEKPGQHRQEDGNVLGAEFTPAVDCTGKPCIALSFDDGPNAVDTPRVLGVLEQKHVAATFFLVGKNISGNEGLVKRIAADHYEIGNHTWDHSHLTTMTPAQINDEVMRTQTAIAAAGSPLPTLFRPPYGEINPAVVENIGLQVALWNEDPMDWAATDPVALTNSVLAAAKPGGVVDFHDIQSITADVLPSVIDQLSQRGYRFVTVSELLHSRDRPGNAPFYGYASP
jgi:peptidoglycan/xylan/chitin deacetylase (PgdA/CDA1 family)